MKLKDLISKTKILSASGDLDKEISGISYDSRKVKKGDIFVAIPGTMEDGTRYIPMAVQNGAVAVIREEKSNFDGFNTPSLFERGGQGVSDITVPSSRAALADISCTYFGDPSMRLKVIGITGTNGKTTTAYIMDSILKKIPAKTGLISTVETHISDKVFPSVLTTPESYDLQKLFSQMLEQGVSHAVMEVSSHAIALKRIKGVALDCAVYTNLSHDHLDFHSTLESYLDTKLKLFRSLGSSGKRGVFGAVNIDDKYSEAVSEETDGDVITYSLEKNADVSGRITRQELGRMNMEIRSGKDVFEIKTSLPGRFNAYNILAAVACAKGLKVGQDKIKAGIEALSAVPGRLQLIDNGQAFKVVVDFAHSPDSLEKLLCFLSPFKSGRIILVFGCTGDRDKLKRPVMGAIAAKYADITIVTSDDPHNEDPAEIIKAVEKGFVSSSAAEGRQYLKITGRKEAIDKAIEIAAAGDIVVIAGRGHEKFQETKGVNIEIDDCSVAKTALQKKLS
ncbi:MAG: UDP-N-acetylmuramoyl-L-alanyl-D-glutamate--2,6-diaminopimelate ligase [Candidatus Margulisiibacteriota bacterium]